MRADLQRLKRDTESGRMATASSGAVVVAEESGLRATMPQAPPVSGSVSTSLDIVQTLAICRFSSLNGTGGTLVASRPVGEHAFPSGPGASSLGCLDTDSFRVIRCCATERASQRGARHGYGTNINIPRSTVTPWPRSRGGLPKMVSNTYVRTQVQCCARSRRSCSLTPKTTGGLRVGWRNLDGFGP